MSGAEEDRKRAQRAEQVALFRYQLIREAADPGLTVRQRGRMVREIAGREHAGPFGEPVTVSRATADRWIRAWRSGGFEALAPPARQVTLRTDPEVLELAAGLKRENPERTAAQVERILRKIVRLVAVGADAAAALRPAGAEHPPGRAGPGGIRPVRGARRRTTSGPGTRCTARRSRAARPTCSLSWTIIPGR